MRYYDKSRGGKATQSAKMITLIEKAIKIGGYRVIIIDNLSMLSTFVGCIENSLFQMILSSIGVTLGLGIRRGLTATDPRIDQISSTLRSLREDLCALDVTTGIRTGRSAKDHLRGYEIALKQAERFREEFVMRWIGWMDLFNTPDGMIHEQSLQKLAECVVMTDGMIRKQIETCRHLAQIKEEIAKAINRPEKPEEREILYLRYLFLMKWNHIEEKTGYNYRRILRIHNRALQNYRVPDKTI